MKFSGLQMLTAYEKLHTCILLIHRDHLGKKGVVLTIILVNDILELLQKFGSTTVLNFKLENVSKISEQFLKAQVAVLNLAKISSKRIRISNFGSGK